MFSSCNNIFIVAIIFGSLKEKSAVLISGFNYFSKEKQEKYNRNKINYK